MTRVLFMGRKPVAADALSFLLSLDQVQIVGVLTDSHLAVSPTSDLAGQHNLPLYKFGEALAAMKAGSLDYDLGISMLYWRKLKEEFLTVPARGTINFHPAPLPEYKGTAGYNLAILEGLDRWAASAHYIDEEFDTGGIIEVASFDISREEETAQSLECTTQPVMLELFKRTLERALSRSDCLPVTPNVGGRYVSRDEMEAMKEVREGDDVSRMIRAFWFPPYDGAYMMINGVKCTLIDRYILQKLGDTNTSNLFVPKTK